jgi:hypothetical protein
MGGQINRCYASVLEEIQDFIRIQISVTGTPKSPKQSMHKHIIVGTEIALHKFEHYVPIIQTIGKDQIMITGVTKNVNGNVVKHTRRT